MLVFIIPLKSRAVASDWRHTSLLCERTLRSVCAQSTPDFRVLLVANEAPDIRFAHPSLSVITEPFPIPGSDSRSRMRDKGLKLKRGLLACKDLPSFHVMFVDADDCVSNRLAAHANHHPDQMGWFIERGWIHEEESPFLIVRRNFHLYCGTSHILRCRSDDLPEDITTPDEARWITNCGHSEWVSFFKARRTPLAPLPFPGAVYCMGHGENCDGTGIRNIYSGRMVLHRLFSTRLITRRIRREFGLHRVEEEGGAGSRAGTEGPTA